MSTLNTTEYKYSIKFSSLGMALICYFNFGIYYVFFDALLANKTTEVLILTPFIIIFVIGAIYYSKKYFIPAVKREVILSIDEEKLVNYFRNESVYWEDVDEISTSSTKYHSYILLKMSGGLVVSIPTTYIAADDDKLLEEIEMYFYNANFLR